MLDIMESVLDLNIGINRWFVRAAKKLVNISAGELYILWKIHSKGIIKDSELSYDVGVPADSLTPILDRFEARNLVIRVDDAMDRRSLLICETPKLNALAEAWRSALSAEFQEFCSTLPEGLGEQMKKGLLALKQHTDRYEA